MKRDALALALALALGLPLLTGAAWAWGFHGRSHGFVHSGRANIFIGHGPVSVHRPFVIRDGFEHPHLRAPFAVVAPVPRLVCPFGFWRWNGFAWVRGPGC